MSVFPGFTLNHGIAFGSRAQGLLEIKFHNPKTKNSISAEGQ